LAGDLRFENSIGQVAPDLRHGVAHVVHRAVDGRADHELDPGRGNALGDIGRDLVDAVDAADSCLDPLTDLSLDLGRRRARLSHDDLNGREFNVRIVVDVHPDEADDPQQSQRSEENQRNDRVAN
jgi:hypothetical protein